MMSILGILDVLLGTPLLYSPSGARLSDSPLFHFCSFAAELVPHKNPPAKTFAANDSNGREEERERPAGRRQRPRMSFCAPLCGLRTTLAKSVICAMVMAFHGTFSGDTEACVHSHNYFCCASVLLNCIYFGVE